MTHRELKVANILKEFDSMTVGEYDDINEELSANITVECSSNSTEKRLNVLENYSSIFEAVVDASGNIVVVSENSNGNQDTVTYESDKASDFFIHTTLWLLKTI